MKHDAIVTRYLPYGGYIIARAGKFKKDLDGLMWLVYDGRKDAGVFPVNPKKSTKKQHRKAARQLLDKLNIDKKLSKSSRQPDRWIHLIKD